MSPSMPTLASALSYCCRSCPQALTRRTAPLATTIANEVCRKCCAHDLKERLGWYVIGDQSGPTWATHLIRHLQ